MSSKFTNRRGGEEDRTKSVGYDTRIIRTSSDVITCKYGPPFSIFEDSSMGGGRTCTYASSWRLLSTANSRRSIAVLHISDWILASSTDRSPTIRFIKERAFARAQPLSPSFRERRCVPGHVEATYIARIFPSNELDTVFSDLLDRCFDSVSMFDRDDVRESFRDRGICIRVCRNKRKLL